MTSELVAEASAINGAELEFTRRLSLLGLSQEQIQPLFDREKVVIEARQNPYQELWAERTFEEDAIPVPEALTISEMIVVKSNRGDRFWEANHHLEGDDWANALLDHIEQVRGETPCNMIRETLLGFGWTKDQADAFEYNEAILIDLAKGNDVEAPWTDQTTRIPFC